MREIIRVGVGGCSSISISLSGRLFSQRESFTNLGVFVCTRFMSVYKVCICTKAFRLLFLLTDAVS